MNTKEFEIIHSFNSSLSDFIDLTVVVPTSNTAEYLPACLSSLTSQTNLKIELIVIDYKSNDKSLDIIIEFAKNNIQLPITIVRQNNSGLGDARNFGFKLSKGEFVAYLDSDDFFTPNSYSLMVQYARVHDCEIVFCRAMVFDDMTKDTYPFYDDWVMVDILNGCSSITTNYAREPRLFKLEPNASIRIMRRSFIENCHIHYPEKKRAEDVVPHYRSLFMATNIGIISYVGFFYRVGREGKLTDNPSGWIEDLLFASQNAISYSYNFNINDEIGAAMIYFFIRSLYLYGTKLPHLERSNYYKKVCLIILQLPRQWIITALRKPLHPDSLLSLYLKIALIGCRADDPAFLFYWSGRPNSRISIILNILMHPKVFFLIISNLNFRSIFNPNRRSIAELLYG